MERLTSLDWLFTALLVIGGINWGLIGLLDFNLVAALFGPNTFLSNIIYVLVGAAALYVLISFTTKTTRTR